MIGLDSASYLDFTVTIRSGGPPTKGLDAQQLLASFETPAGALTNVPFSMPVTPDDVERALAGVSAVSQPYAQRAAPREVVDPIRWVGQTLFAALLGGRQELLYRQSRTIADDQNSGLRFRLRILDWPTARLPWEFLHDGRDFLSLSVRTPVTRLPVDATGVRELSLKATLRLLVIAANPFHLRQVDVDGNLSALEGIQRATPGLELTIIRDGTLAQMRSALREQDPDILHILAAVMRSTDGTQQLVLTAERAGKVANDLHDANVLAKAVGEAPSLRLVHLRASEGNEIAARLAEVGPAVIGVQGEIRPESERAFTTGLLLSMFAGGALASALAEGRQAIDLQSPGSREWGLPILYDASAGGLLFDRASAPGKKARARPESRPETANDAPKGRSAERRKLEAILAIRRRNLDVLQDQAMTSKGTYYRTEIESTEQEIAAIEHQLDEMA